MPGDCVIQAHGGSTTEEKLKVLETYKKKIENIDSTGWQ